jgi:hypothetical protein
MSSVPSKPLRLALQLVSLFGAVAEFVGQSVAHGVLQKRMGNFQLTGQADASLREVNGGRMCVNGFGKVPPGYYFTTDVSIEECAQVAHDQPNPLGFRWGRPGFDYSAYNDYAQPEAQGGNVSRPVDLGHLFRDSGDFTCTIYVGHDSRGQPVPFVKSNVSARFAPKLKDGPAESVCFQRWTMTEFFKPAVGELWFCYMPATAASVEGCRSLADAFYFQGKIFVCIFIFFLGVLGWIMADMPEFETPLVWFTRLLLNLELGLVSTAFLLERWFDTESPTFFVAAFFLDIFGAWLLFVPYYIMERLSEDSPFNTSYLLFLAFSPCFLMEFMSYWSHFMLLVRHLPLLTGFLSFAMTALSIRYMHFTQELKEMARDLAFPGRKKKREEKEKSKLSAADKASYAKLPTEEPPESRCSCGSKWVNRLPACV